MAKIEGLATVAKPRQRIKDIRPSGPVDSTFLVRSKHLGIGKNGKSWMSVLLCDASGEIDGRIWDDADEASTAMQEGTFVHIRGQGNQYLDKLQLKIDTWSVVDATTIDPNEFLARSSVSTARLLKRLDECMLDWTNEGFEKLYLSYRNDRQFMQAFERSPAAKTIHHAYIGGLFEHTVSMLELAVATARHYENLGLPVDRDVLRLGVLLHDSGKIHELSSEPGFGYTDVGRLLGHIYIGAREADKRMDALELDANDKNELLHLILSHHGELEYGSPKRPKTLEAFILNSIDNMDSKVQTWVDVTDREQDGGAWSQFVPSLSRYLKKKQNT